jgi:hypothetical protein
MWQYCSIESSMWYQLLYFNLKNSGEPVTHSCDPSYSGVRDQEDHGSKPAQQIVYETLSWKTPSKKELVEWFKCTNPSTKKKKKKKYSLDLLIKIIMLKVLKKPAFWNQLSSFIWEAVYPIHDFWSGSLLFLFLASMEPFIVHHIITTISSQSTHIICAKGK